MTTVADYLIQSLSDVGVNNYFGVQGGACAHLIQSAALGNKTQFIPVLNEQAAGLYAHGHYKSTQEISGAIVTTGPGFFNLMTGIAACYYDRVPLVVLCGQVNSQSNLADHYGVRMYGFQEAEHALIAENISVQSIQVSDSSSLCHALTRINDISNLNGPLFLDIQDDLQRQDIDDLIGEFSSVKGQRSVAFNISGAAESTLDILTHKKRPVFLVGAGVCSSAFDYINEFSRAHNIPILFSWGAQFLMDSGNLLHQGIFGNHSPGQGNDLLKQSDQLICLGLSLLQHQVGQDRGVFAPNADILFVNNDLAECSRVGIDFSPRAIAYQSDALEFSRLLVDSSERSDKKFWNEQVWDFPWGGGFEWPHVNGAVKCLMDVLRGCPNNSIVFSDAGATLSWTYQAANLVESPPVYTAYNLHTMGYAIPAAIGSVITTKETSVVITGDGGFMMNVQELAQATHRNIKTIVLDNKGYGIIRQTQNDFLGGRHAGSSMEFSKAPLPRYDVASLTEAFGIPTKRCGPSNLSEAINWLFKDRKARCVVIDIDPDLIVEGVGI